jgi:outer membrane biosynthesis protein TonB
MSGHEDPEALSAYLDDALDAAARARVAAHLAACADCRRERDALGRVVGLLRAEPPVRAPVGFVDRVLGATGTAPRRSLWHRLFVPLRIKLPLEAAAVVLLAGTALYVFERSPELKQAARPAPPPAPPAVTAPGAPPAAPPAPSTAPPSPAPMKKEAAPPAVAEAPAQPAKPGAPAGARSEARSDSAARDAREAEAPAPAREQAPAAAATPQPAAPPPPAARRLAAKALVSVDVTGRLVVADRAAAGDAVAALVARLGGTVLARRPDPATPGGDVVELTLPRAAVAELGPALARLGEWRPDPVAAALPDPVRVVVRLGP